MPSASSPFRLPWHLRLAAFLAAILLSLSLLVVYAAGVKFVGVVARVSALVAQSESSPPASNPSPQEKSEPGVVSVGIIPQEKKDK